jgi:AdoMet-dependent rRNA methyltransferase SPB1
LDKYYYLAKEKGYRSRAAFKLVQLNKKYGFLQKSRCLIDLCAAPGGWLQVAAETMPIKSLIVGVDLAPIKPVPKTITFQGDITTDKTRAIIRGHLKTWKADTVIHDGAPNVGTAWVQDAFSQNELVLHSLRLACDFLGPGGNFVTKVFRSKDSAKLEWTFKQLFDKVEQTKPPSSRNVSAETFYVCRGYKAPKNLDPRFLDPQYAFAEVKDAVPNNEAKVFNPEVKKRKREGYDEGDWTQYHEVPVSDFIQTTDPIAILGGMNKLTFDQSGNGDIALATIDKLPETTEEVRICCNDLKVLGKKEFRLLLKWRLQVRERFGFATKSTDHKKTTEAEKKEAAAAAADDEENAEVESMDEEMKLQEELQNMKDNLSKDKRKARRKENEKKQKEVIRLQMNMTTPMEIGMDQAGPNGDDAMFQLKAVDKAGLTGKLQRSKMQVVPVTDKKDDEFGIEYTDDELGDGLEGELDAMYNRYTEKREERDSKLRAKKARKERNEEGEFEGFSNDEEADSDDGGPAIEYDSDSDDEEPAQLITDLDNSAAPANGLTKRAANFFDQDLFKDIDGLDGLEDEEPLKDLDSGIEMDSSSASPPLKAEKPVTKPAKVEKPIKEKKEKAAKKSKVPTPAELAAEEAAYETDSSDGGFEIVKNTQSQWDKDEDAIPLKNGRPNIDIITAEAMTLAHQLATGQVTKQNLMDDNFNKYSLRDVDGLPEWFLDDEGKNSKPHRPITKEAAAAIKEKMRAFNARPIKKVREAKARKQLHAAQKLEKLKRKSALLAESEDVSEKDKANNISKIMARAGKSKKRKPVQVIVAGKGKHRGQGRPGGVKGKYKMVDARMKKDVRGEKRLKKKMGKK